MIIYILKKLLGTVLLLSACSSSVLTNDNFYEEVNEKKISNLVFRSVYNLNGSSHFNFEENFLNLCKEEKIIYCRTLAYLYWNCHDDKNEDSVKIRFNIVSILSSPIGFCGKQESKRIALHSKNEKERNFALRFYDFNPSVLDNPFLIEYANNHGLDEAPFPIYPDPFMEYNLRKYISYIESFGNGGKMVTFKKASQLLKKDIYEELDEIWNESFNKLAFSMLISNGYTEEDLVPEKFTVTSEQKIVIQHIINMFLEKKQ